MKYLISSLFLMLTTCCLVAQNNTFPSSGNVGIGTTSPNSPLTVVGSQSSEQNVANITNASDQDFVIRLSAAGAAVKRTIIGPSTFGRFSLGINYNESLTIVNGGIVGVGTTNPIYGRFQVTQGSDASDQGIAILNSTGGRAMRIWTDANNSYIYSNGVGTSPLILNGGGNVGIGTKNPDQLLTVKGIIHASEVLIDLNVPGPDYVFEQSYKLPRLEEVKSYVESNKHLPEVPSAQEMEKNGVKAGEMNMILLKKVEELTLYLIEANKRINDQQKEIEYLKKSIQK